LKFHSPDRPRLSVTPHSLGVGQYVWDGKPVAALPDLIIAPRPEEAFDIQIMLQSTPGQYTWYEAMLPMDQIPFFLAAWLADPEQVMVDYFKYPGPTKSPAGSEELSAGDLF
jgi:hypothetical protein